MAPFGSFNVKKASLVSAAASFLMLSGCQPNQYPPSVPKAPSWQVIESVGDARVENDQSRYATSLHPRDEIADSSRIVTGRSSHLILSNGDVQVRATSNSSIGLSAPRSPSILSHHYGSVRVRLSAAANDVKQIAAPHLIASGTNAVFDMQVDDQGSLITVTSGSITLSTANGAHHAQLAKGASARMGEKTDGQLEIRAAAGMPFKPSSALMTAPSAEQPAEMEEGLGPAMPSSDKVASDRASPKPTDMAIVPASRLRTVIPRPETPAAETSISGPDKPAKQSAAMDVSATDREADMLMKRRQQFDELTQGLLGNLQAADIETYRGL